MTPTAGMDELKPEEPLTRPSATLSPSDGERAGVRGLHLICRSPSVLGTSCGASLVALLLLVTFGAIAEVAPVAIHAPKTNGWVGQRIAFYVDLRARGTFAGSASISVPRVPGVVVLDVGHPVVTMEELEGESWFVQRHEFALFSQRSGTVEVPAFGVRFSRRDGFTGPASEVEAEAPSLSLIVRRPPGSEQIGYLITTETLDVTETWEPTPGPAEVGAVFKRTIVQRAPQLTGMALAPAPTTAPEGVRVYPGDATTNDRLARGEFLGERRETITYLVQKPGSLELPAITYVWWNPKTEKLLSKKLPAVRFQVAAIPAQTAETSRSGSLLWTISVVVLLGMVVWQREKLRSVWRSLVLALNPPERAAFRRLVSASRKNDAGAAFSAWNSWRNLLPTTDLPVEVRETHRDLMGHLYSKNPSRDWSGASLAEAVGRFRRSRSGESAASDRPILPTLNPTRAEPLP